MSTHEPQTDLRAAAFLLAGRRQAPPMETLTRAALLTALRNGDADARRRAILALAGEVTAAASLVDCALDPDAAFSDDDRLLAFRLAVPLAEDAAIHRLEAALDASTSVDRRIELLQARCLRHDERLPQVCEWILTEDPADEARTEARRLLQADDDRICREELLPFPMVHPFRVLDRYLATEAIRLVGLPAELQVHALSDPEDLALARSMWRGTLEPWRRASARATLRELTGAYLGSSSKKPPAARLSARLLVPANTKTGSHTKPADIDLRIDQPVRVCGQVVTAQVTILQPPPGSHLARCLPGFEDGFVWLRKQGLLPQPVVAYGRIVRTETGDLTAFCHNQLPHGVELGDVTVPLHDLVAYVQHPRWRAGAPTNPA